MVAFVSVLVSFLLSGLATYCASGTKQPDGEVCDGAPCPDTVSLLQLRFEAPVSSRMAATHSAGTFTPVKQTTKDAFKAAGGDEQLIEDNLK